MMKNIYGLNGNLDMVDSEGNKVDSKKVFFVITKIINKFDKDIAIIEGDIFFNRRSFKNGDGNINKWFFDDKAVRWFIDNKISISDSGETDLYDEYCNGLGNAQKKARDLLKKLDGGDDWDNVKINFRSFKEDDSDDETGDDSDIPRKKRKGDR